MIATIDSATGACRRYAILLVPGFPMMAFSSAIEPLRAANLLTGRTLYEWHLLSPAGHPAHASSGIGVLPDTSLEATPQLDSIFVCGGVAPTAVDDARTLGWLAERARAGTALGSISTGTFVLAEAGLLAGYRCTSHWESLPALAEAYPELEVTGALFEIDRDRYTCSGGTAALDLMLHLIALDHGEPLAEAVSDNFLHGRIRAGRDRQPMTEQIRLRARAPKLAAAIDLMQTHIEQPLSTADLAERVGISRRQLERLFQEYRGARPSEYYLAVRLEHARVLLLETGLSILQVALASGFSSQSHFGACYREQYGHTPGFERGGASVK